jgi:hypothetical protein
MGQLSKKLRSIEGGGLSYWCQGCQEMHAVRVGEGSGPRWGYNGNPEAPTFTPSVLVTSGHFAPGHLPGAGCWCTYDDDQGDDPNPFKCSVCHTFITDGKVQFLSDCTHARAGQTLDLPDLPERDEVE